MMNSVSLSHGNVLIFLLHGAWCHVSFASNVYDWYNAFAKSWFDALRLMSCSFVKGRVQFRFSVWREESRLARGLTLWREKRKESRSLMREVFLLCFFFFFLSLVLLAKRWAPHLVVVRSVCTQEGRPKGPPTDDSYLYYLDFSWAIWCSSFGMLDC